MDDLPPMRVIQGRAHLLDDVQRLIQAFRLLIVQCAALNQLHDDVGFALEFSGVKYGHDIGVVELGNRLSFVEQARPTLRTKVGVGHQFGCNIAVEG